MPLSILLTCSEEYQLPPFYTALIFIGDGDAYLEALN